MCYAAPHPNPYHPNKPPNPNPNPEPNPILSTTLQPSLYPQTGCYEDQSKCPHIASRLSMLVLSMLQVQEHTHKHTH